MFDQAVKASEAVRESAGLSSGALIPALCGCVTCGTVQMIAAPAPGVCDDCGAALTAVGAGQPTGGAIVPEAA